MFSFIDPKHYGDFPSDAIGAAADTVYALSALVSHAPEEAFSERTRSGLALVLTAAVTVLDDSAETVEKMIGEPRAEGYREGVLEADKAHRKGVNNGRNSLRGDIAKVHPEWAEKHLTTVRGVARVVEISRSAEEELRENPRSSDRVLRENPRGAGGEPRENPRGYDVRPRDEADGETYPKLGDDRPDASADPGGYPLEPPRANGTTD